MIFLGVLIVVAAALAYLLYREIRPKPANKWESWTLEQLGWRLNEIHDKAIVLRDRGDRTEFTDGLLTRLENLAAEYDEITAEVHRREDAAMHRHDRVQAALDKLKEDD